MKKISVMLLAALMLFAFTACDDNPNEDVVSISDPDLKIAQAAYTEVVKDINSKFTTGTDDPEQAAGGKHDITMNHESVNYDIEYDFSHTKEGDTAVWSVKVTVTADEYVMTFTVGSDSAENIEVTVGDATYTVGAVDLKGNNQIEGGVETDGEEATEPEEEEQAPTGDDSDEEGVTEDEYEPVD